MICATCGGNYVVKNEALSLVDSRVGEIIIYDAEYYKCDRCGDILLTIDTSKKISDEIKKTTQDFLSSLPISDFVSAKEASEILEISKQALHKNKRINRGFVYCLDFGGVKVYNIRSLNLFKNSGDGRFSLVAKFTLPKYVQSEFVIQATPVNYNIPKGFHNPIFKHSDMSDKVKPSKFLANC